MKLASSIVAIAVVAGAFNYTPEKDVARSAANCAWTQLPYQVELLPGREGTSR